MGTETTKEIENRFLELMKRDPIVIEAIGKYREFVSQNSLPDKTILELPQDIKSAFSKVSKKWPIPLIAWHTDLEKLLIQKTPVLVREYKPSKLITGAPIPYMMESDDGDVFVKRPGHLYLEINLSVLDKKDKPRLNEAVWDIVMAHIQNRRSRGSEIKKWMPSYPEGEPQELSYLYHMKEKTFRRYLKWYDMHMEDELGFRLIAFIEKESKGDPVKAKELIEKIKSLAKRPTVGISVVENNITVVPTAKSRTYKDSLRTKTTVQGEDKVEKGIKLIYQAIHRKPYVKIEKVIEEYSCPEHPGNNDCSFDPEDPDSPSNCKYLETWEKIFNKRYR